MLSNLFKIDERIFQPSTDSSHPPKSGALELFALEEGLSIFEEPDVVARYGLNQMFCGGQLPKRDPKMVCVIERI